MPAKSPEAIARKKQRKNEKNRAVAAMRRAANPNLSKTIKRQMMPRLPVNMTKSELRAMLTQAVQNTAAMNAQ